MHSYRPEELFDEDGRLVAGAGRARAQGRPAHGRQPARQRRQAHVRSRSSPTSATTRSRSPQPATERHESTRAARQDDARHLHAQPRASNFRLFCPDETNSNRLGDVFEVENRCSVGRSLPIDDHVAPDGRVMEVLSEHLCRAGWRATS